METKTEHEYVVTESTLDVRHYTVWSEVELTEDELWTVFYEVDYVDNATNTFEINGKKGTVRFDGTEFGDDGQIEYEKGG